MKIKITLTLLFFAILVSSTYSQSVKTDTFYRAAGIDATFINNFLPFDNTIGSRGKYLFHYIKFKKTGKFTRHAFDIDIFGRFENNESDIDRDDARFNIDYKISRGKKRRVFKRGYIWYGTEAAVDYFLNQRAVIDPNDPDGESFNTNLDQTISASIGPFLGLEFKLSKRVSIYTEAGIFLNFVYGIDSFDSEFTPENNFRDTSISVRDQFN
ncbi:MAG: hypothetical protein AB8F74_12240, partial [Saprospiraceae bacterium]